VAGEAVGGEDGVDPPRTQRLLSFERPPGDDGLGCDSRADESWQPDASAAAGNDPDGDLGLLQADARGADAQRAGQRDLVASARGQAVDGSDRRLRDFLEEAQRPGPRARLLRRRVPFAALTRSEGSAWLMNTPPAPPASMMTLTRSGRAARFSSKSPSSITEPKSMQLSGKRVKVSSVTES